jgi:hypothetical protein
MKNILSLLVLLACAYTCRSQSGTYTLSTGEFAYSMVLHPDSTFEYSLSFSRGGTSSKGKWKIIKDTVCLYGYEKPYTIEKVQESRIDSLRSSMIHVIINDSSILHTRGNAVVYIDGKPSNIKYKAGSGEQVVTDFKILLNDDCSHPLWTDANGNILCKDKNTRSISVEYDTYLVRDTENNYFVLTLSGYPVNVSPPTLTWTKWILSGNSLAPVECGKALDHIILKKH